MASEITQENLDKLVLFLHLNMVGARTGIDAEFENGIVLGLGRAIMWLNASFGTDYVVNEREIRQRYDSSDQRPYKKK